MKRTTLKLWLSAWIVAGAFAASANAQINVNINLAPPARQTELVPAIPAGYAWAPGYWGWNGDRYVWVRGRQIVQREGYRWEPDRWEQRDRAFHRVGGHWERDHGFKTVKVKKQKKHKDRDDDDRDEGNRGHGQGKHKGKKHDD